MRLSRFIMLPLAWVALAGCTEDVLPSDARSKDPAIIGGVPDTGDPAVVVLSIHKRGDTSFRQVCTGFVVSPHVIVTAAHCIHPRTIQDDFPQIGTDFAVEVFTAPDVLATNWANGIPAKSTHYNPLYDIVYLAKPPRSFDVGVVIVENPMNVVPLPFNRRPLGPTVVGQNVRQVGYGMTDRAVRRGGIKYQTITRLSRITNDMLFFADEDHTQCHGDSGGPSILNINGVETAIGLSSWGPPNKDGEYNCSEGSWNIRTDAVSAFIDLYVIQHDPPFGPPPVDASVDALPVFDGGTPIVDGGPVTPATDGEVPAPLDGGLLDAAVETDASGGTEVPVGGQNPNPNDPNGEPTNPALTGNGNPLRAGCSAAPGTHAQPIQLLLLVALALLVSMRRRLLRSNGVRDNLRTP